MRRMRRSRMRSRPACLFAALWLAVSTRGAVPARPVLDAMDAFNREVQQRFETLAGAPPADPTKMDFGERMASLVADREFGMSRFTVQRSLNQHFVPEFKSLTDCRPVNKTELGLIAELEAAKIQAGLYLIGRRVIDSPGEEQNFRALKGPAIITRGTPRPEWYPSMLTLENENRDTLPNWLEIYPTAQRAMKSFRDGGKGFETDFKSWHLMARPVIATQARCVICHNNPAFGLRERVVLQEAIGGILYAYRQTPPR